MPNPKEKETEREKTMNASVAAVAAALKRVPSSSNTAYEDMHVASIIHFTSNRIHNSLLF